MKTFSQFMSETVIKLRGFGNSPDSVEGAKRIKTSAFMQDLEDTSKSHPLNDKARIIGKAHVHVSPNSGNIHIHDIQSHEQGSGAGTHALKHLTSLADKHGVKLTLNASGYSNTKSSQLKRWYKKHGFEHNSEKSEAMSRPPATKS